MPKERKLSDEIGRFVGIPQAMWQDGKLVVSGSAFRVWCALRFWIETHADDSMPNRDTLMQLTDIGNTRTLAAAIQELISEGWLETKKPFGESRRYAVMVPIRYRSKSATVAPTATTQTTEPALDTPYGSESATVAESQPLLNDTAYGSTFATVAGGKSATVGTSPYKELSQKKKNKREEEREKEEPVLSKPKRKSSKPRDPPKPVDDAFLAEMQANPAYEALDVRVVYGKVLSWCAVNPGEQPSRKRLVNWLNTEKPSASNKRTATPDAEFEFTANTRY